MHRILGFSLLCLTVILPVGCGRDETPTSPATSTAPLANQFLDPDLAAGEIVLASGWEFASDVPLPSRLALLLEKCFGGFIQDFQREVITGDIVHYSIVLAVGPGEFDVIGLHRVVRERRPHVPIKAQNSLFLVHGMGKDFVGNFLPGRKSPLLPDDIGFAVFMAQNDIDVWGIDSSYTLVPPGLEDFGFAAGWGMDKSINDIAAGIAVARTVRLFTGNGWRKMTLFGYSQGAIMGYAFLNRETQMPSGLRSVGSFIPVDWGLAFDDPDAQADECDYLTGYVDFWNDGVYGFDDDPDGFLAAVGYLAQTDPDDLSPFYEGFTNLEVFLFFTAVPSTLTPMHWWAGIYDSDGWPLDFAYTTRLMATEFWLHWAPMHPPVHLWVDFHSINCEESIWETNLAAIDLPVLSLEAAGGGGLAMAGTLDRLCSAEVTRHVVQLLGPDDAWRDFGHIDLFTAEDAAMLAWQPTLDWITNLRGGDASDLPAVDVVLSSEALDELRSLHPQVPSTGQYFNAPAPAARPVAATPASDEPSLPGRNVRLRQLPERR